MTQDFTDDALAHVTRERDDLETEVAQLLQRIIDMERAFDSLSQEKEDLEREVDWLRDRLSEKPYA